ncbi:unnamed protein product [Schistocephalus solidus]|uniref:PRKCSH-like domain-containing protein n=1 Tax=Schistocephalus solidus TaxID=70667 RepID=A0A183SA47_SCHSO|nr:unnamed protein product [Schistocephalus solidus]
MMTTLVYVIQALLLVHFHSILANLLPKGVPPEYAPFYVPGENFTCLDKSATHPWSRVNDDYCDCRDGSDEPGTSACIDMKFYCENAGHKSKFIFSSFVNDKGREFMVAAKVNLCGVGALPLSIRQSDSSEDKQAPENNLRHLAEAHKADLIRARQNVEKGHEIYKEYVARARSLRFFPFLGNVFAQHRYRFQTEFFPSLDRNGTPLWGVAPVFGE